MGLEEVLDDLRAEVLPPMASATAATGRASSAQPFSSTFARSSSSMYPLYPSSIVIHFPSRCRHFCSSSHARMSASQARTSREMSWNQWPGAPPASSPSASPLSATSAPYCRSPMSRCSFW